MDIVKQIKEQQKIEKSIDNIKEAISPKIEVEKFAPRVKSIKIKYNFDGKDKSTTLSSKVMDYEQRLHYERVIATLQDGMRADLLSTETRNRHMCLARIATQCIDPSDWVLEAAGEDLEFCFQLARRLLDHEAEYFRYSGSESGSQESKPRFSID